MNSDSSLRAFLLLLGTLVFSMAAAATAPTYIFNRSDIPLNQSGDPIAIGEGSVYNPKTII